MAYALAIYFEPAPAQLVWIISIYPHFFLRGITDNNCTLIVLIFFLFPTLVVGSASPCCYDSHCKPDKRYSLYEDPNKVVLPKLGFGGLHYCKC
jgi:hypothetical protein